MIRQNSINPTDHWDYIRYRLRGFGISMIVLAGCLMLYYLGFFGTYEGPLNPQNLGHVLDNRGISKSHIAYLFIGLFILLLTWNWVFNLVSLLTDNRRYCLEVDEENRCCGAKVSKDAIFNASGEKVTRYKCRNGHISARARFEPVRKGPWGYCLCLALALISGMCIYWI